MRLLAAHLAARLVRTHNLFRVTVLRARYVFVHSTTFVRATLMLILFGLALLAVLCRIFLRGLFFSRPPPFSRQVGSLRVAAYPLIVSRAFIEGLHYA